MLLAWNSPTHGSALTQPLFKQFQIASQWPTEQNQGGPLKNTTNNLLLKRNTFRFKRYQIQIQAEQHHRPSEAGHGAAPLARSTDKERRPSSAAAESNRVPAATGVPARPAPFPPRALATQAQIEATNGGLPAPRPGPRHRAAPAGPRRD